MKFCPKAEPHKNLVNGYWPKCEDLRLESTWNYVDDVCGENASWFESK